MNLKLYPIIFSISLLILFITGCSQRDIDVASLRQENANFDLAALEVYEEDYPLPDYPLTLEDVLQIVFDHNLDLLVQEHERAVQAELTIAEQLKMLPPLTIDGIFSVRSKNTASLTKILGPGPSSIQPQLSSLNETRQWDVRDTLNLIDFGLEYYKSKQEKTRTSIIDQQHLRTKQKLILDTITSYWKAVTAQKVADEAYQTMALSKKMRMSLDRQIKLRSISEIQGLHTSSKLIDTELELYAVRSQLESAKAELAGFMGLPPEISFTLADVDISDEEIDVGDVRILEEQAILSRPELASKDLEETIAAESVRMAIIQMFPNIGIFEDYNADGNPFLLFHYWASAGIKATWNLFNIPQQMHLKRAAEEQAEQAYGARLALSVAVMTQVRIAYLGYQKSIDDFRTAQQAYEIKRRLSNAAEKEHLAGEFHGADALSFRADATVARVIALRAYGNLKVSIEQLNYAIGVPLMFNEINMNRNCVNEVEDDIEIIEEIQSESTLEIEEEELVIYN